MAGTGQEPAPTPDPIHMRPDMHHVVLRTVALLAAVTALAACGASGVAGDQVARDQLAGGQHDRAIVLETASPERASTTLGARVLALLRVGKRDRSVPDPLVARAERDAATEALRDAKASLVAQVNALISRFEGLEARLKLASDERRVRLAKLIAALEGDLTGVQSQLATLEVALGNETAYQHGMLELRTSWLDQRLTEAERAMSVPLQPSVIASAGASGR
ncbi:MAG: hypothetical protein OXR73_02845 [Myxococcales bacterium]|nr:hypothetical protein [Myxococcales bacterium]